MPDGDSLLTDISVAILSTKVPILLGHGYWRFGLAKLSSRNSSGSSPAMAQGSFSKSIALAADAMSWPMAFSSATARGSIPLPTPLPSASLRS